MLFEALTLLCILLFTVAVYRLTLHPLSHLPGPWIFCISSIPQWAIVFLGIEPQILAHYHRQYKTRVLRIAPSLVSISDPKALATIYVADGGFVKDGRYRNFDVNGRPTIFSAIDKAYRDVRAKAVLPLFAPARIRAAQEGQNVQRYVERFIARLNGERSRVKSVSSTSSRVDILDLALRLSMDVMTGYMFDRSYGALDEDSSGRSQPRKFSESPWLQAIAAFGYYSMLPPWLFSKALLVHTSLLDPARGASVRRVGAFVESVVGDKANMASTYHGRLSAAGATEEEIIGICGGSLFAGTSSTGQTLATILFHLVRQPSIRDRVHQELRESDTADLQSLPYLKAVVNEGLRLAMTNPAPLTRTVAKVGCHVDGVHLPEGVSVGAAIYVMHHDPEAFPEPFTFRPERWLEMADERRDQCFFPFGLGSRSCIGRNLALCELFEAVAATVKSKVLEGSVACEEKIVVSGCFNGEVQGHAIEICWTDNR